jgi:glyoxylase-like metal-dependent hydrolase (beta-lactamase superfamily II)
MIHLSRRTFALGLPAASIAAGYALSATGGTAPTQADISNTGTPLAQISIGRFTVTALVDGYADMSFSYFPNRTPEETGVIADSQFATKPGDIRYMFNQYLVDDSERLILIDTGPAGAMGNTGHLPGALAAVGVRADLIDAIVVTHMHVDHLGGLVAGGRRNFPNAEIYVDRRDVTYWTDPARRAAAPDFLKNSFDASAEVIRLYPKLQAIDGERQITRGVSIVDLTGHTPGHIGVRVEDGGQSLLMVSDMLFPAIHPAAADIGFLFEQDPTAAREMRARLLPRAAEEKGLIAATHMPFPGLGRIVSDGGRLRWLAVDGAHQG